MRAVEVTVATALVAACPVAAVWWARDSGRVSSPVIGVVLGMVLSLGASSAGCLIWERLPASQDLLFNELMLWGYLHRWRVQRRLASALQMVSEMEAGGRHAVPAESARDHAKQLESLVASIETRDPYLDGHSRRVARHARTIARRMGLPRAEVARIHTAAALHDVGKLTTPTAILHKAGSLSDEEYSVIKQHPGEGALMVAPLEDPQLAAMIRHHHERLDGSGYPDRLTGDQIPLGARIISVADTFDAITSKRSYRGARAHSRAIDILQAEAGTQLDPTVVRAFCSVYTGRTPIAMWAFVAGLPEKVLTWLAGSAGAVASAVKVATVAAVVGSAAVTSAALGVSRAVMPQSSRASVSSAATRAGGAPAQSTPAVATTRSPARASSGASAGAAGPSHRRRAHRMHSSAPATALPAASTIATQTTPAQPSSVAPAPAQPAQPESHAPSSGSSAGGSGSTQPTPPATGEKGAEQPAEKAPTTSSSGETTSGKPVETETPKASEGEKGKRKGKGVETEKGKGRTTEGEKGRGKTVETEKGKGRTGEGERSNGRGKASEGGEASKGEKGEGERATGRGAERGSSGSTEAPTKIGRGGGKAAREGGAKGSSGVTPAGVS